MMALAVLSAILTVSGTARHRWRRPIYVASCRTYHCDICGKVEHCFGAVRPETFGCIPESVQKQIQNDESEEAA